MTEDQFPDGRLNDEDEGVIDFAVGSMNGRVVVKFSKPVTWFALPEPMIDALVGALRFHAERAVSQRFGEEEPKPERVRCPQCKMELAVVPHRRAKNPPPGPKPGHHGLCINCGALLRFGDSGEPRLATAEEAEALPPGLREKVRKAKEVILLRNDD